MEAKLYFEIECLCFFILLLVYVLRTEKKSAELNGKFYQLLSFLVASVALTDGLAVRYNGINTFAARIITNFSSYYSDAAGHLVCALWLIYDMMWMSGSKSFDVRKKWPWTIPALLGIIMICLNIPFHFIFVIDSANVYHRGPLFFMLFIIPFMYILLSFLYPLVMTLRE